MNNKQKPSARTSKATARKAAQSSSTQKQVSLTQKQASIMEKQILDLPPGFQYRKTVVFDLHGHRTGPIVDWVTPFALFMEKKFDMKINLEKLRLYDMGYMASLGLTSRQFDEAFTEFVRTDGKSGYGSCQLKPGVREAMKRIVDAGIKIEIWTWCPVFNEFDRLSNRAYGHSNAAERTKQLIVSLGLPLRDVDLDLRFLKSDEKVPEMNRERVPVIVEDCPKTVISASQCGLTGIMVEEPYNKEYKAPGRFITARSPEEVADAVIAVFEILEKNGRLLPYNY